MTVFLIGAALLLMTALAFVLPPLLRKDEHHKDDARRDQINLAVLRDQLRELDLDLASGTIDKASYDSARHDLEQRVVDEVRPEAPEPAVTRNRPWAAIAVGLMVPALAVTVYLNIGEPNALDARLRMAQDDGTHDISPQQMEGMVNALAQRLKNEPENINGWVMLARSYSSLEKFGPASEAYAHLEKLMPDDPDLLVDYADALAMASGRSLQGEPERLVDRALRLDPDNTKALSLSGSAAFERGDYAAAVTQWQRILPLLPPDSEYARLTASSIREAQSLLGTAPAASALSPAAPSKAANAAISVQGVVDIDPSLRSQVSEDDVVFVFARAAQGPRIPLAVVRKQVKDLPAAFTLDDSMSMSPEAKLSGVASVVVSALVSKSGNANPSAGDLEGESAPVIPGLSTAALKLRIDRRVN
jgi:cytochrome c-type biogenesis protein CcmH